MKPAPERSKEPLLNFKWFIAMILLLARPVTAQPDLLGYGEPFFNGSSYPFAVSESAAHWGEAVTITFAVANLGNATAGAFTVGIYMSADQVFTTNDARIDSLSFGQLRGGFGTWKLNRKVLLPRRNPLDGQPTTVFFGMILDAENQVSESNEGNNSNLGNGLDRDDTPVTITDARPPGVPKMVLSNHALDGISTTATNHVFTWSAPDSDSGIAGYSYAFDQAPGTNINTTTATATWSNVSVGNHIFQVRAQGNNGLVGEPATFHLIVETGEAPSYWKAWGLLPDGNIRLVLQGSPGSQYVVQRATNLSSTPIDWVDVITNTADGLGEIIYFDPNSTNHTMKYYRSRTP